MDSKIAIQSISNPYKHGVSADIRSNVKKIHKKDYTITFQRIPSHNDIVGNDAVDELAKNAVKLQNIEELPLTFDDICSA